MLKNLFYIVVLVVFAVACNNNPAPNNTNPADTVKVDTVAKKDTIAPRIWIIKDSSMYTKSFLKDLYNNSDSISLVDNYIIYKHDTIYFPDYFDGNRQTLFEGMKDSADYKLQVFNCTYTKVQFIFSVTKNNKLILRHYGEAELLPAFFVAKGTDDDDRDSTMYGVDDYYGKNDKSSYTVRIGAHDSILLGSFFVEGKDSLKECPTLRSSVRYIPKHKRN